jgi:hypothetical protein
MSLVDVFCALHGSESLDSNGKTHVYHLVRWRNQHLILRTNVDHISFSMVTDIWDNEFFAN